MAGYSGFESVIALDDTSGTPQTFTGYTRDIDLSEDQDTPEVSVLGSKGKKFVAGNDGATLTFNGPYDPQIRTWVGAKTTWGTARTLKFSPIGTQTGEPYVQFESLIQSFNTKTSAGGAVEYTLKVIKTGDNSDGTH